jgi:hypothetical protein
MYTVNTKFFSDINTELQAYILAWFWSRGSGHIQVRRDDADVLKIIKDGVAYSGYINCYNTIADLNITNPNFRAHLAEVGCVLNCHCIQVLPIISDDLFRHFVRGIYDSYGTLIMAKNKYPNIGIIYDESFINLLRSKINVESKHYYRYSHTTTVQMIISRTKDAEKFLKWLYGDSNYYLTRKFEQWCQYCQK